MKFDLFHIQSIIPAGAFDINHENSFPYYFKM